MSGTISINFKAANAQQVTTAERSSVVYRAGRLVYDSEEEVLYVGDGSTAGGVVVGSGGSDTFASIEVDGVAVSTNAPTLDFDDSDFTLTESPTDDFDITIDDSGIDHDATTNFVANEHIDHTSVTLTAGTGLTGGGDISASRTFNVSGLTVAEFASQDISQWTNDAGYLTSESQTLQQVTDNGASTDNNLTIDAGGLTNSQININGSTHHALISTATDLFKIRDTSGAVDRVIISSTQTSLGNFTLNTDQTVGAGQDNYVLTYDNSSGEIGLEEAASGGTPGGSNTEIQFNASGSFDGAPAFTFTDATDFPILTLGDDTQTESPILQFKTLSTNGSVNTINFGNESTANLVQIQSDTSAPNLTFAVNSSNQMTIEDGNVIVHNSFIPSSNIRAGNGTSSVPIYSFSTDTDTGMYRDSTFGFLKFVLNTVEALSLESAGIRFHNAYQFPNADGNANEVLTTDGSGNLDFQPVSSGGGTPEFAWFLG